MSTPPRGIEEGRSLQSIADDHRVVQRRLDTLTKTADRRGVLASLRDLPRLLAEHFADEEVAGGLYEDLARRRPELAADLEAMRREHLALLAELEALSRELESRPASEATLDESSRRSVARCADRLRRHERDEARMVADVYYTEEGGRG